MEMEDPDIVIDLCEKNKSSGEKCKVFWEQCKNFLQEKSAVHKKRHDKLTYLAAALSIRDLIQQVKEKHPKCTPVPSEQ